MADTYTLADLMEEQRTLGGRPALPDVRPREMRQPPLGQSNLVDRALSSFGQPSLEALRMGLEGKATPQEVARTFLETGPMGPFGAVRAPNRIWYRGDPEPFPLEQFDPARTGTANSGHGAFFLSPTQRGAADYGQVREFSSTHSQPFVWDLDNISDTLTRARQVWPEFNPGRNNDVWWMGGREHTTSFTDRLRRAGFDSIELTQGGNVRELAVFDPARTLRGAPARAPQERTSGTTKGTTRVPNPIRAYHGSLHDFDEFRLDRIGTGEGAQAYGHGLYFAEAEPVARTYRDNMSLSASQHSRETQRAQQEVSRLRAQLDSTQGDENRSLVGQWLRDAERTLGHLQSKPPGRMYEVNLHARPEQFLDWDRNLAQQSPEHSNVLGSMYRDLVPRRDRPPGPTPTTVMQALEARHGPARATEILSEAGIPGIRYLDQGSRTAGAGTSNYVVFSPEIIEILRKYGIIAPPVGAAAASTLAGEPQQ